eukprot:3539023-Rhodomonas_salina.4
MTPRTWRRRTITMTLRSHAPLVATRLLCVGTDVRHAATRRRRCGTSWESSTRGTRGHRVAGVRCDAASAPRLRSALLPFFRLVCRKTLGP